MKRFEVVKIKKIVLVFLCSWLISCGNGKSVSIPDDVLSKEKMVQVMTDMHLLEASMNLNIVSASGDNPGKDIENRTAVIFKKNEVTKEQYERSFAFYTEHTELLSELYTEVLNNLSQLQAKVANEKTPEEMLPVKDKEAKKDSLNRTEKKHPDDGNVKRPPPMPMQRNLQIRKKSPK